MSASDRGTTRHQIPGASTNLPRWPADPPPIDERGASFLVITVGTDTQAAETAERWLARIAELRRPCERLSAARAEDIVPAVAHAIDTAFVGLRVLVTGPERDVLMIRSAVLAAGAVSAEVCCHAAPPGGHEPRAMNIWCVACRRQNAGVTAHLTTCRHCGAALAVHAHFSPRYAARLGAVSAPPNMP
ncbi:hypothetical protein J5X84_20095 [Streptosporangiaceae bacterium NEAU-GS5]|nr:hypothetical protein [Streptosporangiaceae bacterium NEAU-GS5]